jgi:hypothetical protein
MMFTPEAKISAAIVGVIHEPPAEFSPLAITQFELAAQAREEIVHGAPTWFAHDVADEKNLHAAKVPARARLARSDLRNGVWGFGAGDEPTREKFETNTTGQGKTS